MWIVKLIMGTGLKIKLYAGAALGFIALLGVAVLKGRSIEKQKQVKKELKDYVDTRKKIDAAQRDVAGVDPIKRLRERLNKRDL